MNQEKKNLSSVLYAIILLLGLFVIASWISESNMTSNKLINGIRYKINNNIYTIRGIYVFLIFLACYLTPAIFLKRSLTENWKIFSVSFALLFSVLIVIGSSNNNFYNQWIYPIILMTHLPLAALTILSLKTTNLNNEELFKGVTKRKSDFYFEFKTEYGSMRVHSPQQNIWIDGGPGSGKSGTFINSIIIQSATRGYAGWIYDYEGDPTQENSPILSRIAYTALLNAKKNNPKLKLEYAFINFTDMMKTVRVNVLSDKYYNPNNASLFIRNIAITLMKNLEPSWKEKTDFWANNAINYVYSVAYKCYKDRDKGINTLPHVISICLSECDAVFRWIKEDKEIAKNMASMISAWELGAQQQTAGAVSSAQLPLVLLNNKYIYWVLSAKPDEEFNLDITNKKKPILLCIGNAPSIREAISPAISSIASVIMEQMNQPGKNKSIFCADEFPTINLHNIDIFSSTARKHKVATILALQSYKQAVRDYGKDSAEIIRDNCGTQFYGMTNSRETAEGIEKLLGEIKQINYSFTDQSSGEGSESQSYQKEKVLKARDVAGQPTGHFFGKVANGKPPYLYSQFNYTAIESIEIPDFSKLVNTGDKSKDREIMEKIIQQNYERIEKETEEILAPFVSHKTA